MKIPPPHWLNESPILSPDGDLLGYREPAEAIAASLRAAHPRSSGQEDGHNAGSLIVTLEGFWGTGKTSFSNLLLHELRDHDDPWRAPVEVWFSAWQSASMPLSPWEALAYRLGEAFYSRFHRWCLRGQGKGSEVTIGHPLWKALDPELSRPKPDPELKIKPHSVKLNEERLHWLEVAFRLSNAVREKDWDPCLKLFNDAPSKIGSRSLDNRIGMKALIDLAAGVLSMAVAKPDKVIGSTAEAAKLFLEQRLIEGPGWGIDTLEFVRGLNRLLYVLHPGARDWRAVIVVDDTTRLNEEDLPRVLDALGYLRELDDVLVILNVNDHVIKQLKGIRRGFAERDPEEPPGSFGEDFLTRLVNVRFPMPQPQEAELWRMMARFLEDLGMPPVTVVSPALRHLGNSRKVTPREVKRALQWLWFRLGPDSADTQRVALDSLDGEELERLLILLLDLHLFTEGLQSGAAVMERSFDHAKVLLHLPVQPWNLRPWLDGLGNDLELWYAYPEALRLIEVARRQELIFYCGAERAEQGLQDGKQAWAAWRQRMVTENWLDLSEELLAKDPKHLLAHLLARIEEIMLAQIEEINLKMILLASQLTAAARYQNFVDDPGRCWEHQACSGLLAELDFDKDRLIMVASKLAHRVDCAAKAWLLVFVIDPMTATRSIKHIKQQPQLAARIPEEALTMLNTLVAQQRGQDTSKE